jgi:tetratricopeptide (TPR) repeat protein
MWAGDYEAAILIFEQALTLETGDLETGQSYNYARSLNQYLRARLAFAYMMTDQSHRADPLLDTLSVEVFEDQAIQQMVNKLAQAQAHDLTSLETCIAMFNNFTEGYPGNWDVIPQIRVGYTGDDLYYYDNPYQPEQIGCDAPHMLQSVLELMELPINVSPIDMLADMGVGVRQSFEIDVNQDGIAEWLIWPDVSGVEIFLVPDDEIYQLHLTSLDPFMTSLDMREITLPEENETAIALVMPRFSLAPLWSDVYSMYAGAMQGTASCSLPDGEVSTVKALKLVQWQGERFEPIFTEWYCGESLEGIFVKDATQLNLMALDCADLDCWESVGRQQIYVWEADKHTFVAPEAIAQPGSSPQPLQSTATPKPSPPYSHVIQGLEQDDFVTVVDMTEDSASTPDALYIRALALEALNRQQDAFNQFLAISEFTPDSVWGKLAVLHSHER